MKNMKRYIGKITIGAVMCLILICAALWALWPRPAMADDTMMPAHTNYFGGTYTNPYVVFVDVDPSSATGGMVFDSSSGVAADGETWEANAITATQDDDSDLWKFTSPTLPRYRRIIACIGDNASPVETDVTTKFLYDPYTKQMYPYSLPMAPGKVLVGQP